MTSVDGMPFDEETLLERLRRAWSSETSTLWTEEGPQFYNVIDGQRYDLTAGQFETPLDDLDQPAERSEVLAHTNETQYETLAGNVSDVMNEPSFVG